MVIRRFYSPNESGGASGGGDGKGGAQDGGDNGEGGAGTEDDGEGGESDDDKPVNRADHNRALSDLQRFKRASKDSETKIANLEREIREMKRKGQEDNVEDLKAQLAEATQKNERLQANVITAEKNRAILPALVEAGLRADAKNVLRHLDLEDLEVEISTHGNITIHGIESFVKKVRKEYPYAFEVKKAKKVDSGGTGGGDPGGSGDWTPAKLVELERKCKKDGNMAKYHEAMKEYQEQKSKAK